MRHAKHFIAALCVVVVVVGAGATVLALLVPRGFTEEHGYRFRKQALVEETQKPLTYAPEKSCLQADCHGEKAPEERAIELAGGHEQMGCQACHGPALAHVQSKGKEKAPVMPEAVAELTAVCMHCHKVRAGLPKKFGSVEDFESHRSDMGGEDEETCVDCHDPHTCEVD